MKFLLLLILIGLFWFFVKSYLLGQKIRAEAERLRRDGGRATGYTSPYTDEKDISNRARIINEKSPKEEG